MPRGLERMTDAEKQALLQKKQRFDELSAEDRHKLEQLHDELAQAPDCDRLRSVLDRYYQWLRTLPPGERAQLISLPTDERLTRIREIMKSQEGQRFRMMVDGSLSQDDKQVIQRWLDEFAARHEEEILAAMADDRFREKMKELDPEKRRLILSGVIWRPGNEMPRPTAEDRLQLSESLSREAREMLARASNDEERDRVLNNWIRAATFSRMWKQPSAEELEEFAKNRLSPPQRDYLESLPRDRMFDELRKMYYRDRIPPDRRFGSGMRRGRGPGPGPPPPESGTDQHRRGKR